MVVGSIHGTVSGVELEPFVRANFPGCWSDVANNAMPFFHDQEMENKNFFVNLSPHQ